MVAPILDPSKRLDFEVVELAKEGERATLIDQLRDLDREPPRDARELDRKRALLREIMQLDEQIEILTRDWMRELREGED